MPFACTMQATEAVQEDGAIDVIPLARSSEASYRRDQLLPIMHQTRFEPQGEERGPYVTGYALEGTFAPFFGGQSGEEGDLPATSPAGTRIIVYGSAAGFDDEVIGLTRFHRLFAFLGTSAFVLENMVDWLAREQSLVPARVKRAPSPMEPVSSATRKLIKFGNSVGMAVLILLGGGLSWLIRDRRRRRISL
jgi:hypothetical protein